MFFKITICDFGVLRSFDFGGGNCAIRNLVILAVIAASLMTYEPDFYIQNAFNPILHTVINW